VACGVCGLVPHARSCPVRLAPGWVLPPREELPGSPHEEQPDRPDTLLPLSGSRAERVQAAIAMRSAGLKYSEIGQALGVSESCAHVYVNRG
jgi:DNA-directed RNA polymerase specialized sigma24 family protein